MIYINLKDIHIAIIEQVKSELAKTNYNTVEFTSKDITEGITRPSLFLDFENNETNALLQHTKERNLDIKIYYYTKDREHAKIELMEMQDLLSNIFLKEIYVNESFSIPVDKIQFDKNNKDGYLIATIPDIYILEEVEIDGELLENLNLNIERI